MLCPECGNLREDCADPDRDWFPQRHVCNASAVRERSQRIFREMHQKASPDGAGYLPTDGVTVWVSKHDLTPGDDFLE